MSKLQKTKEKSEWVKIGPCLYRYRGGKYYALLKQGGKQIRRSLETADLPLARRKLAELRNDLETTDSTLAARTLETQAERFGATLTGAKSTLDNNKRTLSKILSDWPKENPRVLLKIRKTDCAQWVARYGLSVNTINKMVTLARRFFDSAVDDGAIPRNPMDGIKYRKPPKLTRLTPTAEEFDALVADLRSQKANGHGAEDTADFIELSGTLGLGQAELSGIQRQHISLTLGTIQVFRRKTTEAFVVPIYPAARATVQRRLAAMTPEPTARLLPLGNCKKGLAAACKRLVFPHFEPRSLRRYFITTALRAGVDAPTVAAWQGHTDGGALVLKTYGAAVRLNHSLKMAALLGPKPANVNEMRGAA